MMQGAADRFKQDVCVERLEEELGGLRIQDLGHFRPRQAAGHGDRFQGRRGPAEVAEQRDAVHARHHEIRDHELDLRGVAVVDRERLFAVPGFDHAVGVLFERLAGDLPRPDTSIIKASIYVDDAVMDMAYILEREMGEDFVFAPSGRKWIDVMQRGVSKATGIKQVMEARHARAEEVVAFGDSMNDYEIMRMVGTSIAMGNGRSAIKEISTKVIGPNTEHAVQRELEALLSMMGK